MFKRLIEYLRYKAELKKHNKLVQALRKYRTVEYIIGR